jgi:hypothetical protein
MCSWHLSVFCCVTGRERRRMNEFKAYGAVCHSKLLEARLGDGQLSIFGIWSSFMRASVKVNTISGGSSVWSACCCCLFAQLAHLCVCVRACVPIVTLLAHVVFLIPCREKSLEAGALRVFILVWLCVWRHTAVPTEFNCIFALGMQLSAVVRRKYSECTCTESNFLDASFKNLDCFIRCTGRYGCAVHSCCLPFCCAALARLPWKRRVELNFHHNPK